ncbi:MAG: TPM domain-containing protein, partial [Gemmatimonadota bacterium]|nr:TPM domain-containing protein [Gemmatimonadota bacterium]
MSFLLIVALFQLQIPTPVGFVNDFAGIIDATSERQMLAVIDEVRAKSRGEIVVVTLADLEGRRAIDVARDIGRAWEVGARGGAGDAGRNTGVVLLLKPGERPGDGAADLAIGTGTGAEGFLPDARAGRIRDAIGRAATESGSYATGLAAGVWLLGQAYAEEFGFELTGQPPVQVPRGTLEPASGAAWIIVPLVIILFLLSGLAGRRGYGGRRPKTSTLSWLLLGMLLGGGRGGGRHGGGWGGGFGDGG